MLDRALANSAAPHANEAVLAAVDALVGRTVPSLDRIGNDHGLAYRGPGGMKKVADRLAVPTTRPPTRGPSRDTSSPMAALELATHEGDAALARTWRQRAGCARAATIIGPLEWAPITAVAHETPVEGATQPLAASYKGIGPFVDKVAPIGAYPPTAVNIGLLTTSVLDGLRAVVVDVDVPARRRSASSLESPSTAALDHRRQDGSHPRLRARRRTRRQAGPPPTSAKVGFAWSRASAATARGLARRSAFLRRRRHPARFASSQAGRRRDRWPPRAPKSCVFRADRATDAERALVATAWLAQGDARSAEHLLEDGARAKDASPLTALLYARCDRRGRRSARNRAIERARDALETTLKAWPTAWEAILGHAQLTARRRGAAEGRLEALREIAQAKAEHASLDPMVTAFEAASAAEGKLFDVSEPSFLRLKKRLDRAATPSPSDRARRRGARPHRRRARAARLPHARASIAARSIASTPKWLEATVAAPSPRSRACATLRDSPTALRQLELGQYVALGDEAGMQRVYDAMLPAERTVPRSASSCPERPRSSSRD